MILLKNQFPTKQKETRKLVPLNTEVVAETIRQRLKTTYKHRQNDRVCKALKIALTLRSSLLIPYLDSIRGIHLGYDIYVDDQGRYFRTQNVTRE